MNDNIPLNNTPLVITKNIPLTLVAYGGGKRRYTVAQEINDFSISKFRKNGIGVTYTDLMKEGLDKPKKQAQYTLKYYLSNGTLFTTTSFRPPRYYATAIKSEVIAKELSKNPPIDPSLVNHFSTSPNSNDMHG